MEMFILTVVIILCALVIVNAGEIYLYLCLLFGSIISDIKKKLNTTKSRKK